MQKVIARLKRDRGNLTEARTYMDTALSIIESIRTKVASQELRASFLASVKHCYELYTDLLMHMHQQQPNVGYDALALQISERARARSLLELLAESRAQIRQGVDPLLLEREHNLQLLLNAKAERQMRLLSGAPTAEQAQAAAKEIAALTTEYQQVEAQIRQNSPRYAALTQPQPLSLREIQTQVLDSETLLLEYSLGEHQSYVWAVTPTSLHSYELPERTEIETAARRVYELLTARNRRLDGETAEARRARVAQADAAYPEAAAALSKMLLGPVASQLGKKRLLIVSDGALQYVPFAALPEPATTAIARPGAQPPLIVGHEIVSLPSASTLSVLRREVGERRPATKIVAVLADPVFDKDDERLKSVNVIKKIGAPVGQSPEPSLPGGVERTRGDIGDDLAQRLPRLYGTRHEATAITSLVSTREGMQALDFAANRTTATSAELSQYRIVHFATHGFINNVHPELSGIVLSLVDQAGQPQDGFLRVHEIFNLKLSAELVVLSACRTGLGKEVKGEGLIGLTRGFMYAGTPRVVVSLWSVTDKATAELMARFYKKMLGAERQSAAAALRAAQVEMWKERRWEAAYYWAAFILQGEWK
ncbi:MAG TPA: CHAT domain-containing protein [Pyrinomonadaceae bacterium]|nr:CHAT domain-containing protein [Pyrinomonadaceae bacterium]